MRGRGHSVRRSHFVQQLLGFLSGQQPQTGRGLQNQRGSGPHGGGDAGPGHKQELLDSCCTLNKKKIINKQPLRWPYLKLYLTKRSLQDRLKFDKLNLKSPKRVQGNVL